MMQKTRDRFNLIIPHLPRMWDWIALTITLFSVIAYIAPQQLSVVLYKSLLVSLAAVMTFWVDRSLFARCADRMNSEAPRDLVTAARTLCRALMFVGCVIGMTMGL